MEEARSLRQAQCRSPHCTRGCIPLRFRCGRSCCHWRHIHSYSSRRFRQPLKLRREGWSRWINRWRPSSLRGCSLAGRPHRGRSMCQYRRVFETRSLSEFVEGSSKYNVEQDNGRYGIILYPLAEFLVNKTIESFVMTGSHFNVGANIEFVISTGIFNLFTLAPLCLSNISRHPASTA